MNSLKKFTALSILIIIILLFYFAVRSKPVFNKTSTESPRNSEIILEYSKSGGIAGTCDYLKIFSDGKYYYQDTCRKGIAKEGSLDPNSFLTLTSMSADFGILSQKWSDGIKNDGFSGEITFKGKNQKKNGEGMVQISAFSEMVLNQVKS